MGSSIDSDAELGLVILFEGTQSNCAIVSSDESDSTLEVSSRGAMVFVVTSCEYCCQIGVPFGRPIPVHTMCVKGEFGF